MSMSFHRGPAKVYAFPAGGRAGLNERREAVKPVAEVKPGHVPGVVFGGAWYHEAAVQDSQRDPKP